MIGQLLKNATELEIKGRITEAIEEVKKAIARNPDDGNLHNRLGDLNLKMGNKDEAVMNFRKGVEVFRRDNFLRNALALSKKILRYEPDGYDMYYTIADVLVELDEKQDAVRYMSEYIERQIEQQRDKEVLNALNYLESLEIKDEGIENRISDYYKKIGIERARKRTATGTVEEQKAIDELKAVVHAHTRASTVGTGPPPRPAAAEAPLKEIEQAIADLRKTVHADSIVPALQKSLGVLSAEQLQAIENMERSVGHDLDEIQTSLKDLAQASGRSTEEMRAALDNLSKALASLSRNQGRNTQQLGTSLGDLKATFKTMTENSLSTIRAVQDGYKQVTREMLDRLEDTRSANVKVAAASGEMKQELGKMSDSIARFIAAQTLSGKKRDLYLLIVLVVISLTCGLVILSLILR
jgi:tetratricopeptide (TPR) repeat protein